MILELQLTDGSKKKVELEAIPTSAMEPDIEKIWIDSTDNLLTIKQYVDGKLDLFAVDYTVGTDEDEIIKLFMDALKDENYSKNIGIEPTQDDEDEKDDLKPYDPDLIRVDTRNFSVFQVYEWMRDGELDLSPDFQRHFVWQEPEKKSRLIESMMLRIPLPVFYLAQDNEGKFQVIDGLQRLTVIKDFLENKFSLKGLEYLEDCERLYFSKDINTELDAKFKRRITQTNLMINIIDPQTPVKVKFEIFKRINEGGKPLKPQEIRNCMASNKTRALLNELSNSNAFKLATNNSVSVLRMEDQEFVLRFISFYYDMVINNSFNYKGWMNGYLDDMLDTLNNNSDIHSTFRSAFLNAMHNSHHLFGNYAFRKVTREILQNSGRSPLINKSLFTTWSVLLAKLDPKKVKQTFKEKYLVEIIADLFEEDKQYFDAVTKGTSDVKNILYSFGIAGNIIKDKINL